jgi:hypothetical protein
MTAFQCFHSFSTWKNQAMDDFWVEFGSRKIDFPPIVMLPCEIVSGSLRELDPASRRSASFYRHSVIGSCKAHEYVVCVPYGVEIFLAYMPTAPIQYLK